MIKSTKIKNFEDKIDNNQIQKRNQHKFEDQRGIFALKKYKKKTLHD